MSLLTWLFPPQKAAKSGTTQPQSSGLSRMEPTRPVSSTRNSATSGKHPADNAQPGNRKSERMARRELLYTVVREAMVRAGMLSSSYKFKVLSLDARGRQFLVMMDLAREHGDETSRLAEIEALIAQSAKSRYDIVVTAVYWRLNDHVAVGLPQTRQPSARPSGPMPLEPLAAAPVSQPAPLVSQPMPLPAARPAAAGGGRYDPIDADEVAAFKQALAAGVKTRPGVAGPAAVGAAATAGGATARAFTDGSSRHGPQSYTLLTGYEDTEMPDETPALSGTQYGALN